MTFIHFSAYRTQIITISKQGERGRSETQFRPKKRISKMRDMQIRNSNKIIKLALRKLNKKTKNVKGRTR